MKKAILFLLILFISMPSVLGMKYSSQNRRAIKLYEKSREELYIPKRIEMIKKAISIDNKFIEAYWTLSDLYLRIDSIDSAVKILETADKSVMIMPEQTKIRLSELYFNQGEYSRALSKINEIGTPYFLDEIYKLKDKYGYALQLKNNPIEFNPKKLNGVNTQYDNYFPSITSDGTKISTTVLLPKDESRKTFQEDLFISEKKGMAWTSSRALPPPINSSENEGAQSFSADGRYMFFVVCGSRENIGSCDIYYSIKVGNGWSYPMNIGEPANSVYWESNPSLSAAGDKLYFTSNRPGGLGGRDIWSVDVEIDEKGYLRTDNARPLGKPINTEKDEFAPFIHPDNTTLYFTSSGHKGLGKNDIFISKKGEEDTWSQPRNIGYPINTHGDESGLVINGKGDKAYFASDQIDGSGKLYIYEIELPTDIRPKAMLNSSGKVYDAKTKRPLQARVEIFEAETNKKYFESTTDAKLGDFIVTLPQEGNYSLIVRKKGYLYHTSPLITPGDSLIVALTPIEKGKSFILNNLFYDWDSYEIMSNSYSEIKHLAEFMSNNPNVNIEIIGHTDDTGTDEYNKELSKLRANSIMHALIQEGISKSRMKAIGMGSSMPIDSNNTEIGRTRNRRVEILIK